MYQRWIIAAVVGVMLAGAAGARASFPGRNGWVTAVYDPACQTGANPPCNKSTIYAITPGSLRAKELIAPFGGGVSDPAWSPSGRTIAFNAAFGIWVAPEDGSAPPKELGERGADRNLRLGPRLQPAWSPDGKRLLFNQDNSSIGIINVDGSDQHILFKAGSNERISHPTWSPDGTTIMFDAGTEVYVMDATGKRVRRLLQEASDPSWAPDGKHVAFLSWQESTTVQGLAVASAKGSGRHLLLRNRYVDKPVWSPDGRKIAYILTYPKPGGVYAINSNGTDPRRLTLLPANPNDGMDWQPIR